MMIKKCHFSGFDVCDVQFVRCQNGISPAKMAIEPSGRNLAKLSNQE